MNSITERFSRGELTAAAHLRGLLDVTRVVRSGSELSVLLAAIARVVSETLGFATVVINIYRPETDDYEVRTVHGNERARAILLDNVSHADTWSPMLDPRFLRSGAFFIPAEALQWDEEIKCYTPQLDAVDADDPMAWQADDALFVTLDGTDGRRFGVISVDEPVSGRRPDDQLLEVLTGVAAHAAQAIESADQLARLQGTLARHRAVLETSLDAVIAVDARGRILEFNPAAERTFGYRRVEAVGRELAELLIAPEDREAHRRGLDRVFETGEGELMDRRIEVVSLRADGTRIPVELSLTMVKGTEDEDAVIYGFARDISERRRGEEQLTYLAYHDPLTGLPNRTLVEEQLDLSIARARRSSHAVAVLFVDLDDFKMVNDRLGHAAGDQLLAAVASRLRTVLRDSDVLARQGGDEFLVVLSDLDQNPARAAESVGAKLHDALREPFVVAGAEVRTGASIGVSLYPDDATDTEALLRHADTAMYKAKGGGGAQLAFHSASEAILARRASVSAQLRRAIAQSELELHYQPVWRLGERRAITSVEALLRWRHPDRGLLKPASFITLAEHSAAGEDLVDWILSCACADAKRWSERGLHPQLSINVSAHQLLASGFPARLRQTLGRETVPASQFMIELTESAWTVGAADTSWALADLRETGVALAIDDFGAGFSSLSRLSELHVDVVKLDRALLGGIPDDQTAVAVLGAIVDLARACDAELIAEGVETEEQITWLADNRIDRVQGFLFGHPLQAHEITPLLSRRLIAAGDPG
jgi:diguanylate cyclase (GGDEF)-like protein/PAS domain S-box-containing protein